MKRVLIVGAGFAGLTAASLLGRWGVREVLLVDRRPTQQNLPLLPDLIGRNMSPDALTFDIARLSRRRGFEFRQATVEHIDLAQRSAVVNGGTRVSFDELIIAAGCVPAFYGRTDLAQCAFTFNSVEAVSSLRSALDQPSCTAAVICGGGYTGVELATNIRRRWLRQRRRGEILLVERSPALLGPLPEAFRRYTVDNVRRLDIAIKTNTELASATPETVVLSDGTRIRAAALVWTAGMETPAFVRALPVAKDRQGRLVVDEHLRFGEGCYAIGDAAHFETAAAGVVRMAVQFAIAQGALVAGNIRALRSGRRVHAYQPRDLGYIVPMANNRSCGLVVKAPVYGMAPTLLHYLMCLYRSSSNRNRRQVMRGLGKNFAWP
jgi:NADH dehydrogenase